MNKFLRKGAKAQRNSGGTTLFAPLRLCVRLAIVIALLVTTARAQPNAAAIVNKYPDRFLFGTDEVAPADQEKYLRVYNQYEPFWKLLTPEASEKVRKKNYERIFDEARRKVRNWEQMNVKAGSGNSGGLK